LRCGTAVVALLVCALGATGSSAGAQEWDPTAAVAAYSAALNAHDVDAALALFDEYGSATDSAGHHFEGRAGLTEFLLDSGFGSPDARITTVSLLVAGNRGIWTYACSCAAGSTDVRLVLNHNKISVFAEIPPRAPPLRKAEAGLLPWLIGLGLLAGAVGGGLGLWRGRSPAPAPRASQGRLLAARVQARATTRVSPTDPRSPVHRP
jgi:hypothetical protein